MPEAPSLTKTYLRIGGFVLGVVALFVAIGNSIPQIGSYPPRSLTKEDFVKLTPEQVIEKGREAFGTGGERCSQCHMMEGPAGRGPNMDGVGARARSRRPGVKARDYLLESMIEPKAFVVPGFSPIMPEVFKPPLELSEHDILAVAAYLESLGGTVDIDSRFELKPEYSQKIRAAKAAASSSGPPKGDLAAGQGLFYQKMRCVACHATIVDGHKTGGVLGPDLSGIGAIQGPDYLRESILDPSATVVAPYKDVMPKHFKENLSGKDVDDLVVFLLSLRES